MRNAVPRFGMRWAVVLAVVAAVALAALLAVGSPASAQSSDDGEEIWSATMTVGDFPIAKGYGQPSSVGSLSDDTFILGQHEFQVNGILDRQIGSRLIVGFAPRQPNDGELRAMKLHLGGRSFAFEDATYASDTTYTHVYSWPLSPRFGWTAGERVAVSINALPMVEVYANDSEVEYGGSGNTDDATIEFLVQPHREHGRSAELQLQLCPNRRDGDTHVPSRARVLLSIPLGHRGGREQQPALHHHVGSAAWGRVRPLAGIR